MEMMYAFALSPGDYAPNGHVNLSNVTGVELRWGGFCVVCGCADSLSFDTMTCNNCERILKLDNRWYINPKLKRSCANSVVEYVKRNRGSVLSLFKMATYVVPTNSLYLYNHINGRLC
jgi:hypothetical protein